MSTIHPLAQGGFSQASEAYERGRPDYPVEAVDWLVAELEIQPGRRLLDLGAGTGKFTRMLVPTGAAIVAVEPVRAMRDQLAARLPGVEVLDGTAETIPLADETIDAVVVAQAFHWFSGWEAIREIRRVLRPGGALALVWNIRDEREDWVARLSEIIDRPDAGVPRYRSGEWRLAFEETTRFASLEGPHLFPHRQRGDRALFRDRFASISHIAAAPPEARAETLAAAERLLDTHPTTRGREIIELPYQTHVYVARRR